MADIANINTSSSPNQANNHTAGAGLYKIVDKKVNVKIFNQQALEFTYPTAVPSSNGINILKDFPWCNSATDKTEVPYVNVKEFELTWGQTVTNLQRFIEGATQVINRKFGDPYLTLYSAKETGFNYCFPRLLNAGSELRSITNTWGKSNDFSVPEWLLGKIGKKIGNLGDILKGAGSLAEGVLPGFGLEETQKFSNTTEQTVSISFPLYNTKDIKTAFKNYCFCLLFAFQNLKTRTTFMTYIPPKLYSLSSPFGGGLYMPVAVVASYAIESIGTTRVLSDHMFDGLTDRPILIPEAYKVTINFKEIISPSANILLGSMGGKQVSVIGDTTKDINNLVGDAVSLFGRLIGAGDDIMSDLRSGVSGNVGNRGTVVSRIQQSGVDFVNNRLNGVSPVPIPNNSLNGVNPVPIP